MWGQIIGTALGALGGSRTGSSSSSGPPKWIRDETKSVLNRARPYYNQAYVPYTGTRVQPLSDMEVRGNQLASDSAGKWQPYLDRAAEMMGRGGRMIENYDLSGYMNPYREKVLDVAARKAAERGGIRLNEIRGNAAARNAFGGSRATMLETNTARDIDQNIDDLYTTGMDAAWRDATGNFYRDNDEMRRGASGYLDLARQGSDLTGEDIARLMRGGETERKLGQAQRDTDYADWLTKQNWDKDQVERYMDFIRKIPSSNVQTGSSSPLAGALGGALQGYALSSRLFPSKSIEDYGNNNVSVGPPDISKG